MLERKAEEKQHLLAFTIYSNLKENMMLGAPRSTLKLMESLRGTYGLVRLDTLKRDGSPAFGIQGNSFAVPELDQAFNTGEQVSFRENGDITLHTILYPLKNDQQCITCHKKQQPILGVLLISLSLEDSLREIATVKRRLTVSVVALAFMMGGVLYFLVRKVVLQPLGILHQGAERIGRGELAHRILLSSNDEMQDLAQSLNMMAGRLEESYSGLEQRIRERTAEVEDKAKRLYEYSRDMATISRISTKVFNAEQSLDEMLDRFMWAVVHGLGHQQSLLCLVDRDRAWLDVKRDSGLGKQLGIESQALSGTEPFAAMVRTGKEMFIPDVSRDPVFNRYQSGDSANVGLHVIPILTGTREKQCWQAKNCVRRDCPAYGREDMKCWLRENTLCGNDLIESYGDKLGYCMACDVFPVLGILIVAVPATRPYRKRDVSVLRILALDMGAALENHRLHDNNRRLVRELLELHNVTAAALADLSLEQALEAFTDSALKFSGLDACNFWLLSEDGSELVRKAGGCRGPASDQNIWPERISADNGVLGRSFRENAIITEYHTVFDDPTPLGAATAQYDFPSLLAVPLRTESRSIGVFSVHKKSTTSFLDTEIAAFMLLANHAAMAINVCLLNQELKNQNKELARSTNLMGGILSSMASGVMLLDRDGTVKLINQAGAGILQTRPEAMMQRPLADLFPDGGLFLQSSVGPYQEIELVKQDGTTIPIGFSIAHYQSVSGLPEGTIVVFRDLTEIKALQAAVLSKERFAAMGQVVAGVAHEIRNPLFSINSVGQIFERELRNPGHLELVRALLSETKRLNQLVEDLLTYGRPIKLSLARCDLIALWEEVIDMHREELAQKRIAITGDLKNAHTLAFLDPNQIRQVFLNLLRNAIDATPAGEEIVIRLLLEDRHITFKVSDTGAGIPAENKGRVFDLFFTTKPKGSGLGLAICKKIVEDHGGTIYLENREPGERTGTMVTVKLPYRGTLQSSK